MMALLLCHVHFHVSGAFELRSWLDLSRLGQTPSPRRDHHDGLAATEDGKIYLFGGYGQYGKPSLNSGPARTDLRYAVLPGEFMTILAGCDFSCQFSRASQGECFGRISPRPAKGHRLL